MANVWPFSLLVLLSGYYQQLVADPVAPVFDMHIYGTNKAHINLSFFDPIALISRWVLALLLTIGAIQLIANGIGG